MTKIIKPDQSVSYFRFEDALNDDGYFKIGQVIIFNQFKQEERDAYIKDGIKYYMVVGYSYGTTITEIKIKELTELKGEYDLILI